MKKTMTTGKIVAQQYFDNMRTVTLDSDDTRDCATIMVEELKRVCPDMEEYWDEVLNELKTTNKGLRGKK